MIRPRLVSLLFAALLACVCAAPSLAQTPEPIRVELDQSLLDKWFVFAPRMVQLAKSGQDLSGPDAEVALRQTMEKMCTDAGLDGYDQCTQVFGYVGMIVENCDGRSRVFRDPIPILRQRLVRLEADERLPQADREHMVAQLREVLAALPDHLPPAHIRLMNANRDRIFAALRHAAPGAN